MKTTAVVKVPKKAGFVIEDIELRSPQSYEVIVEMKSASICGTDVHIWKDDDWAQERITKKIVVGHEGAGEVIEIGEDVTDLKISDKVAFESHIFCDKCSKCKKGLRHLCENMKIIGADTDGLYSKYVVMPARNLWKLDSNITMEHAAMFEPMGNSIYCITKANVRNKNILVLGCGPAGLFVTLISSKLEAQNIICTEKSQVRAELAKKVGATKVYNSYEDVKKDFSELDVVFEMSGNTNLIQIGLELCASSGTFIAFGITPTSKISIDYVNQIIYKCLNVQGIHGRLIFGSWYQLNTIYPLIQKKLSELITHRFHYSEIEKGIQAILNNQAGKILLYF